MINVYLWLGIYILILLAVSYFVSRKQSDEDFLISGRNRGGWQILFSKFAVAMGAGYFITYTGFAYEYGTGVFAMMIGILFGYLLFGYWAAPKIYKNSKRMRFYTMGDYVYDRTESAFSRNIANVVSNVILFFWLLVGVVGGAKIISDFGLLSYSSAFLLTIFIIGAYIYMAGFKAVIITDFIQSIFMLLLLAIVTISIVGGEKLGILFGASYGSIDIATAVGFFLFGLLGIFSYSNVFQLCYAAKNKKKLMHGLGLSIVPIVIVLFFLLLIGMFMSLNVPGLDSGLVFTEALKNFLPVSLFPFAIVLFFAGIMSSADTNIYGISSHFVLHGKPKLMPVRDIRRASVILVVITAIVGLIFRDVVDVSILAGGVTLILSLPIIYLLFGGINSNRFIGSCMGGLVGLVVGVAILGIEPTVALSVLIFSGLGFFWNFGKK